MHRVRTIPLAISWCFLWVVTCGYSQSLCDKIRFKEGSAKGCVGMIVTLTDEDASVPDVYFFEHVAGSRDFRLGNRQGQGFDNSHQFNAPGIYAVRGVFGSGDGAQSVDCLGFIEIVEDKLPDLRIFNCPQRQVLIEVADFGMFEEVWLDLGDNAQRIIAKNVGNLTYTYATAGSFNVRYQGRFKTGFSNCTVATLTVAVANQLPPILIEELSLPAPNQISVGVSTSPLVRLELVEKGAGGDFMSVGQVGGNVKTVVLSNRTPETTIYSYQVQTPKRCGGEKMSNQISSVYLKGEARAQENFLSWQRYQGESFEKYQLLRNGQVYKEFTDKEKTSFADVAPFVECGKMYQYQVVVRLSNGWKVTTNLVPLITSQTISPAIPTNILATVENDRVRLSWKNAAQGQDKVIIQWSEGSNVGTVEVTGNEWIDKPSSFSTHRCYSLSLLNACGISSEKVVVCPVFLKVATNETGDLLEWKPYVGFGNKATYELLMYGENNELLKSIPLASWQQSYAVAKTSDIPFFRKYIIKVSHAEEKTLVSYSNEVIVEENTSWQVPEAFTPNHDGLNDVFLVFGRGISNFQMEIFNRWGHLVFASNDIQQGWNGLVNNVPAPPDVYVYVLSATDNKGNPIQKKGSFLLIR